MGDAENDSTQVTSTHEDLSPPLGASSSQECQENSNKLKVTLLSSGWRSTKGGLSTINRELAIQLAKHPSVEVSVYLPQCSEEDKQVAARHNVHLIEAQKMAGYDNPINWLSSLPEYHAVDCVIGRGAVLGRQEQFIKRTHPYCKWIQVVHTVPGELGMYKEYEENISRVQDKHQVEADLCKLADHVVAIGPKLAEAFSGYLHPYGKNKDVFNLTPGIFSEIADVNQSNEERNSFNVLVFGRGDNEDFQLKGYDIVAQAIAELKDMSYKLVFVGATQGEEEKVARKLVEQGIGPSQLMVRHCNESREKLANLFCEVDLAVMPSRTEGFGLAALEALSAGLPVLVSGNTGLAEALKKVPHGSSCVVESEDPKDWASAIRAVRHKDREMRLGEIEVVRGAYAKKYSWKVQCDKLVETMKVISLEANEIINMASSITSYVSTKETTNFARLCRLLVDVGSHALRNKFDSIHPPAGLHGVLTKSRSILQTLRKKRILNATQWGKLYPALPSSVSSIGFDVSLLMLLLRNICSLTPPATGWDNLPPAADTSAEANIARVMYYRNHVYENASQASVDDATFNSCWQDISNALVGLGADAAAINTLKTESMDPVIEEHYQELLREWKKGDDNSKDRLYEIEELLKHMEGDRKIIESLTDHEGEAKQEKVPLDILARGSLATEVYNRELKEGQGYARRVPIMIIGQARTGKTSLKKSLKGELFNPNEGSTEGIETDPSYFKVTTNFWRTGSNSEDTETEPEFLLDRQVAQNIAKGLKEEERLGDPSKSWTKPSVKDFKVVERSKANSPLTERSEESDSNRIEPSLQDFKVVENAKAPPLRTELSVQPEEPKTSSSVTEQIESDPSPEDSKDHQKVPENVAALVQELLKDNKKFMEGDDMYSVIWDFGGQSVFYDTHPIFLTEKAIYILAYDLSRHPYQKADAPVKQGMYEDIEDTDCQKTNFDYLDFWMSSIYSLVSKNTNRQKTSSPETLALVFLACTHADEPYTENGNPSKEIYGVLKDKIYGDLLKGFFVVDNTKSGSNNECQGVKKLRESVLSVAKELPQMRVEIPLKWLKYEKVLCLLISKGCERISIEEARQIASDECGIDDDVKFRTVLNFLHDQKVLINFNELLELESMVILNPQWLVDVFKEVITFKSFNPPENSVESFNTKENSVERLWKDFETTGILDRKVLDHAWGRFIDDQETCKSLIAIMERFSLLCPWPSEGTTEQYLVPSMLRSPPTGDVLKLLASSQIPSLFVRFESRRVPPGLFSRLILLFHKWTQERWMSPIKPVLFNNVALFHILPHNATSLVLLCHSSSIEIVLCVGDVVALADEASFSCEVDLNVSRDIHRQMRLFLECMRKKFFWLEHMRYEMCVSCPVCSLQKGSSKCRKHCVRGCDCLHLLSDLEMQNLPYCERPVVFGDRRICKEMFAPWFSFSDEQEGRISLTKQQDVNGRNQGEQHKAVSTREQSLVLPDGVLRAIRSQSCDAVDVMAQMEESVKTLQLKSAALADPTAETKQWIRCLAINAKNENRMDIVTHLRSIVPAGTTGPLLAENLDVRCIPFKQRKALTFNLCGGDEWKLLAEKLGMSYDEIRVLDKRTLNPCDVALNLVANSRHLNVGEVYDILVECELAGSADLL